MFAADRVLWGHEALLSHGGSLKKSDSFDPRGDFRGRTGRGGDWEAALDSVRGDVGPTRLADYGDDASLLSLSDLGTGSALCLAIVTSQRPVHTLLQAVSIGAMAGAYRTILTHFSQRYPRIPPIASGCQHSTCVAFDLMTVRMRDLPTLPATVPKLMRLFETAVPGEGEGDGE